MWIELDGIDREKRKNYAVAQYKRWTDKLNIYKKKNLNLKIIKNFEEFKIFVNAMLPV